MGHMTEYRPDSATNHDYIPAAGHDALLPGYDLLMRLLGMNTVYKKLIAQAELRRRDARAGNRLRDRQCHDTCQARLPAART